MAGIQTIKVTLQRDSLQTPWGFRLQGGADFRTPFTVNKVSKIILFFWYIFLLLTLLLLC